MEKRANHGQVWIYRASPVTQSGIVTLFNVSRIQQPRRPSTGPGNPVRAGPTKITNQQQPKRNHPLPANTKKPPPGSVTTTPGRGKLIANFPIQKLQV